MRRRISSSGERKTKLNGGNPSKTATTRRNEDDDNDPT